MTAATICSYFGAQENEMFHCFHCFPNFCPEVMGPDVMILVFLMLSFQPAFSLSSFTLIKRLLSSSSLSAIRVVSSAYQRLLIFLPAKSIPACDSSQATWFPPYFINPQLSCIWTDRTSTFSTVFTQVFSPSQSCSYAPYSLQAPATWFIPTCSYYMQRKKKSHIHLVQLRNGNIQLRKGYRTNEALEYHICK